MMSGPRKRGSAAPKADSQSRRATAVSKSQSAKPGLSNIGGLALDPRGFRYGEKEISEAKLERFENRYPTRPYEIAFSCPEFTCICPKSGFPDFAVIHIKYVPDRYCVELKSLKLYINKFRNEYVFHEDVTNIIMDDLVKLLDPREIEVVGDFHVRGNIKTIITARHKKPQKHPKSKVR